MGLVDESAGEISLAREHFEAALISFEKLHMRGPAVDTRAGLARSALNEGDLETACQQANEIEATLHEIGPLGMEFPIRAFLTCARVWQVAGEKVRMLRMISEGYTELAARAERIRISDWRQSFMENIPEHRELVALWNEFQPLSGDSSNQ